MGWVCWLVGWLVVQWLEKCGLVEEVGSRTGTLIVSLFPPPPRPFQMDFGTKCFLPTKHKNPNANKLGD